MAAALGSPLHATCLWKCSEHSWHTTGVVSARIGALQALQLCLCLQVGCWFCEVETADGKIVADVEWDAHFQVLCVWYLLIPLQRTSLWHWLSQPPSVHQKRLAPLRSPTPQTWQLDCWPTVLSGGRPRASCDAPGADGVLVLCEEHNQIRLGAYLEMPLQESCRWHFSWHPGAPQM